MELLIVLVFVLILFGADKLPQLGEGLGKAIKGFKKSIGHETTDGTISQNNQDIAQRGEHIPGGLNAQSHAPASSHDRPNAPVGPASPIRGGVRETNSLLQNNFPLDHQSTSKLIAVSAHVQAVNMPQQVFLAYVQKYGLG